MAHPGWLLSLVACLLIPNLAAETNVSGIHGLANRLLPGRGDRFKFSLTEEHDLWSRWHQPVKDHYAVTSLTDGKIHIKGTTLSALARGLRHYANEALHLDYFWFLENSGSISGPLPAVKNTLTGSSVVPWRYNLNTVTFSYSFVWYSWEDWENILDWAALRGVNLQLAWVGYEQIFLESFRAIGLTDEEIFPFFSGPAFQAWNRFGNIKGSWGGTGDLPISWIESQFAMQKQIISRMVELGITPILPAFPGFVPDAFHRVRPSANITRSSNWVGVAKYSQDYFLDPLDQASAELQSLFVSKQIEAYGNISCIYTLDQFNEMTPTSGSTNYLTSVSQQTYESLTKANPASVWLMQGWLFISDQTFWTKERIKAYLDGVKEKSSMLILDLYSEVEPQWQRTDSYFDKPWIWCQLHNFGGQMNLFGRIKNITINPIQALKASSSLVGFGLTPEAYEGNEVVYDLLLDQAWHPIPIETEQYFRDWVTLRYSNASKIPPKVYKAYELLRQHVYDSNDPNVPWSGAGVYQLLPSLSGLANRTGHFPAPTALHYDPKYLAEAYYLLIEASEEDKMLWNISAFKLDFADIMRQFLTNGFIDTYQGLVEAFNKTMQAPHQLPSGHIDEGVQSKGQRLLDYLWAIDIALCSNEHFSFEKWLHDAKRWADKLHAGDLFSFNARSLVTVWNWDQPKLNDYAARAWCGLTRSYYRQRWSIFVDGLKNATAIGALNESALTAKIRAFEKEWQYKGFTVDEEIGNNRSF